MNKTEKPEKSIIKLTAAHVRAARGLLHWSLETLAERTGITPGTINRWENGKQEPRKATRERIRQAFEHEGVTFSNGSSPGVKLERKP